MGILSWMQDKLNGGQGSKKSDSVPENNHIQEQCKEELSEWPQGLLLAIGTFGNNKLKEETNNLHQNPPSPRDHLQDLKPEEAVKIQKELSLILQAEAAGESVVFNRGKDICLDHTKSSIGKTSITFLLKKMLVCRNGFSPAPMPSPRDLISNQSRMERMLRAILNNKIYPQSSASTKRISAKYLESTNMLKSADNQYEKIDHYKVHDGSTWVKTDSEYIVLEI
ncbi:hypothetical protein SLEP1_g28397 [Rubroshorea leprosula]|uniref:Uncharacterized protein n=1 Tax=Rubroshorea leprosula TaxID=152421 RepID=A0AAV5JW65_9ROSI|nr:hypothetical protein SLEP1_g28397 [Rubroshorea leprosula]